MVAGVVVAAVCCVVVAVVVIVFFFHDTEACVGLLVVDFVAVDAQVTHLMKKRIELNRNSAHCQTKEIDHGRRSLLFCCFAVVYSFCSV